MKLNQQWKTFFWVAIYLSALALLWRKLQPLGAEAGPLYLIGLYLVFIIGGFFGLVGVDRGVNGKPTEPFIKHLSVTIGFLGLIVLVGIVLAALLTLLIPAVF